MSQDVTSQADGTISDEVEEEVTTETTEDTQDGAEATTETAKSKSNVPKILAEKNKWKAEAEKWKAEAESKEFDETKAQAMINQAIASQKASDLNNQERNNFIEVYGEEDLGKVDEVRKEHPSLSHEQAATIAGVGVTQTSNPNKYSFAGNTPASIKKAKTTQTLSDDELRASLVSEFQDAGYRNAN